MQIRGAKQTDNKSKMSKKFISQITHRQAIKIKLNC